MSRVKVMISIPEEFLNEIDKVAKEENRSRSELLREAAKLYFKVRETSQTPGQDARVQKAVAIQDALAHHDTLEDWDSTTEIRKWRDNK